MAPEFDFLTQGFFKKWSVSVGCAFSADRIEVTIMALGLAERKVQIKGL